MKRKISVTLLAAAVCATVCLTAAACGKKHEHRFAEGFAYDGEHHWRECLDEDCREKVDTAHHTWKLKDSHGGHSHYGCTDCPAERSVKSETSVSEERWRAAFGEAMFNNVTVNFSELRGDALRTQLEIKRSGDAVYLRGEARSMTESPLAVSEGALAFSLSSLGESFGRFTYDGERGRYLWEDGEFDRIGKASCSVYFSDSALYAVELTFTDSLSPSITHRFEYRDWGVTQVSPPQACAHEWAVDLETVDGILKRSFFCSRCHTDIRAFRENGVSYMWDGEEVTVYDGKVISGKGSVSPCVISEDGVIGIMMNRAYSYYSIDTERRSIGDYAPSGEPKFVYDHFSVRIEFYEGGYARIERALLSSSVCRWELFDGNIITVYHYNTPAQSFSVSSDGELIAMD